MCPSRIDLWQDEKTLFYTRLTSQRIKLYDEYGYLFCHIWNLISLSSSNVQFSTLDLQKQTYVEFE
jgi:hypothetical protein